MWVVSWDRAVEGWEILNWLESFVVVEVEASTLLLLCEQLGGVEAKKRLESSNWKQIIGQ